MRRLLVLASILFASTATADTPSPAVGAVLENARSVKACAAHAERTLQEILALSAAADAAEQTALLARAREVEQTMLRCIDDARSSQTASPSTVALRHTEIIESQHEMHVVARDVAIGRVGVARTIERVDGSGTITDDAVRTAFAQAVPRIESCQQSFAARSGMRSSTVELSFTLEPNGRVSRALVEGDSARDAVFRACLENAGRSITSSPVLGGAAVFSATLRFGS